GRPARARECDWGEVGWGERGGVGAGVDPQDDGGGVVEDAPAGGQETALQGVGGGVVVAGEAAAQRGADGVGEHGQGDIEVDVEWDGAAERVDVEGADGLGEALFDGHAAGVAFDDLFRASGAVVGDDDGGAVAAEAAHDELADGAGVGRQGGFLVDDLGAAVGAVTVQAHAAPRGGRQPLDVAGASPA